MMYDSFGGLIWDPPNQTWGFHSSHPPCRGPKPKPLDPYILKPISKGLRQQPLTFKPAGSLDDQDEVPDEGVHRRVALRSTAGAWDLIYSWVSSWV